MGLFTGETLFMSCHSRSQSRVFLLNLWIDLASISLRGHHVDIVAHGVSYHDLLVWHGSLKRHESWLHLEGHAVLAHRHHHLLVGVDHLRLHHMRLHHVRLHHLRLHHLWNKHWLLTIEGMWLRFSNHLNWNLVCFSCWNSLWLFNELWLKISKVYLRFRTFNIVTFLLNNIWMSTMGWLLIRFIRAGLSIIFDFHRIFFVWYLLLVQMVRNCCLHISSGINLNMILGIVEKLRLVHIDRLLIEVL
jgi:hypothetical protein